jgi:hypothetical protein
MATRVRSTAASTRRTTRCLTLLNLVPTAEDMPEMAIALIQEGGSSRFEAMAQIAESWS